jgi:Lipocalin-like domain
MLLRGIAAGMAASVSRALTSAIVHDNAIPSNSGQAIRQQGIKSRTSSVIGVIFLAATLAALSRTSTAWGAEQTTHEQDHPLSIGEQIVGTWWLDSIYEEDSRGEDIDQFGVAPTGLFMADRNGNFSFQIMSIDGRRYAAKGLSPAGMGAAGIAEAMTYFGTYAVNERNHKLTLHLEYCLFRSCDNTDRTAELKILGDTMEFISTFDTSPTGASYSRTAWKRRCCI